MRKLFIGLVIGCFIFLIPALAISEDSVFRLTDGYFQIQNSRPHHLICKPIEKQYLRLEDNFTLWLSWVIKEGKESPCPRRGDCFCSLKLELLGKDLDGKETVWNLWNFKERKIGTDISWMVPGYIPKKAAFGEAKIRIRITDKEGKKTYYLFEIPIEIR